MGARVVRVAINIAKTNAALGVRTDFLAPVRA